MLWSFKSLSNFSFKASGLRVQLPENRQEDLPSNLPTIAITEVPAGTSASGQGGFSTALPDLCPCGHQQQQFCPYCEYDQTFRVEGSIFLETGTSSPNIADSMDYAQMDGSDGPCPSGSRPRKLRKTRSDYQQIQYEVLDIEAVISARPNSILSSHSRTPLLINGQKSKPNYLPLPPEKKTPKKLEKKGKRQRAGSIPDPSVAYSTFSELSDGPQRTIKVVKSKSFLNPKTDRPHGPRPPPVFGSIDTDALVSLAWTGRKSLDLPQNDIVTSDYDDSPPYRGSPPYSDSPPHHGSPSYSLSPVSSIVEQDNVPRPRYPADLLISGTPGERKRATLRKPKESGNSPPRPWTMAMVITDDGVTDEKLVDDLENMRIKDPVVEQNIVPDEYVSYFQIPPDYHTQLYDSFAEYPPQYGESIPEPMTPSDVSWSSARQALLICRELVRTERRYLASLKNLITNGTSTPPPTQMLSYLPSLIDASGVLLSLMEENPSVKGVSQAFLSCKHALGDAFVSWSGVVGHFFDSDDALKGRSNSQDPSELNLLEYRSRTISIQGLLTDHNLPIVVSEPNKIRKNGKTRPSVRDLAIGPTQRIVRYVLLYKELRALTPVTHSSFSFVESAVLAAESIARAADQAQGHKAFSQPSPQQPEIIPSEHYVQ